MTERPIGYKLGLASLSGFLLTLAFPRWNLWPLAWVGLVPLFYALDGAENRRQGFLFGFVAGFVFYLLSISWLRHVTGFGLFFVAAICGAYWGVFGTVGLLAVPLPKVPGSERFFKEPGTFGRGTVFLACCWTALEFIRTEIPVWGFGWNLLGTSQAANLWVAQLASLGGVYSVSFLVFLGNAVVYELIRSVGAAPCGRPPTLVPSENIGRARGPAPTIILFSLLLAGTLFFGWRRVKNFTPQSLFRVSVLQGNIPQLLKWDAAYKEEILKIYLNLTELASYDGPQLIIWPEAAYPGFFNRELNAERVKERVRKIQIPVLVGGPHQEEQDFYNSAYLLGASGEIVQRYDKIRLVPFGEYVPWKPIFGFLEPYAYALGVSDFSAGREFAVFRMGESGPRFSVLICFEDIFPDLARKFVEQGADFLTVMTNDAWFGRSSAPYQHLQASVFRAIENGISVVRAANTGVSGFITPAGQMVERVRNQEGKDTFVMGGMTYPVVTARATTIYRQGGWLFPYGCLGVMGLGLLIRRLPSWRKVAVLLLLLTFVAGGCIRFTGGAFYAKKKPEEKPQVKEIHVDTDELLERKAPGKIEV